MSRISQEVIDRINETADIVDVVARHVDLKQRGRNFFGLCPFHDEKTPSFSVAPDKKIYHCFGCGNGGNAVNFIMEYEKIGFVEALQELGGQLGIEVALSNEDGSKELFNQLYQLHEIATSLYQNTLFSDQGLKAKKYLLSRGVTEESIKLFNIGFAPKKSTFLYNKIENKNYDKKAIEQSGLFGNSNSNFYDRFRSRIMFPISNTSGKVIAFGGRAFDSDDPAKYMNSPETPLYRKSEVFYGLNLTRDHIRKKQSAILVEGYTDLIQLYQHGINNCIAVSGTAFNSRHVSQITRFTSQVLLAYDGDSAGSNATLKTGYILLRGGLEVKVIIIPDGLDPDEWLNRDGADGFTLNGIDKSIGLLSYHLKTSNFSEESPSNKSLIIKKILSETVEIKDPIIKQHIIKTLAQIAGVEENQIISMIGRSPVRRKNSIDEVESDEETLCTINDKATLGIINALSANNVEIKELITNTLNIDDIENKKLKKLIRKYIVDEKIDSSEIINQFDSLENKNIVSKLLMEDDETTELFQMAEDCLKTLSNGTLKKEIKIIRAVIRKSEASGEDITDLMKKVVQLQKKLND